MKEKLIQIITEAGEILNEGFYREKNVIFKSQRDLVTEYDVRVENFLKEKFLTNFPEFNILAEESDNSNLIFHNTIIIDPIDGTTNFVNGVPHTCISVGVYKEKKGYMGAVYNPILNEFYFAEAGCGAFLNGEKIHVSKAENLKTSLIGTGFPVACVSDEKTLKNVIENLTRIISQVQCTRRFGSAALDLCYVAKGMLSGFYELHLNPWDVSAGMIIIEEAGGQVSNGFGGGYNFFEDKMIVATNGKIHQELLKNLVSL